jgi:hypothetical protein
MATAVLPNEEAPTNSEENHLESFSLIWLDADVNIKENRDTQQKLRAIINHLKEFHDARECQQYIEQRSKEDSLVLIVSGRLGEEVVPCIHNFHQVSSIYVYCTDKTKNEQWACKFAKVRLS